MSTQTRDNNHTVGLVGPKLYLNLQRILSCNLWFNHKFVLGYKRCFKCRSRGELGSCKDPFSYTNTSAVEHIAGVETIPCSSGWCGKVQEGGANSFKDEGIITS